MQEVLDKSIGQVWVTRETGHELEVKFINNSAIISYLVRWPPEVNLLEQVPLSIFMGKLTRVWSANWHP